MAICYQCEQKKRPLINAHHHFVKDELVYNLRGWFCLDCLGIKESEKTIRRILYLIVNSITKDYYDPHISGLSDDDYRKCIELLKLLRDKSKEKENEKEWL